MIKVKGYQWGDHKQFIGEYEIPALNEESVHVPPNTTLTAPPAIPAGKEAVWNDTSWQLQDKLAPPVIPPMPMNIAPKPSV
jgi:hypothetical protein